MNKQRKKGQKRSSKPLVMPGFDYGIDRKTAVVTAPAFNDKMRQKAGSDKMGYRRSFCTFAPLA